MSEALILFLHQLTWRHIVHWITSSIRENSKLKPGENMLCTEIVSDNQNNFCTQHVLPMFCKKKIIWQRFTCTANNGTWSRVEDMFKNNETCFQNNGSVRNKMEVTKNLFVIVGLIFFTLLFWNFCHRNMLTIILIKDYLWKLSALSELKSKKFGLIYFYLFL